jgi:membrane associated rhomboid family serine protease
MSMPIVVLMGITIAISLIGIYGQRDMTKYVFHPYEIKRNKRWFQFITSGFIHADLMHLFFNMLTLYFFADVVYSVLGMQFFTIYFGSMIIADLPDYFRHKDNYNFRSLGASGAVSGIIFASILFNPTSTMMIFPLPIPIPAPIFAALYLVYCTIANRRSQDNINHGAHFWGAIAGLLLTIVLEPRALAFFFESIFG